MRILCLGNNTEDTDLQTRALSAQAQMPCHGLLSELDQPFSDLDYSQPGYYHSSVVDIQRGNLKELMNQFDLVIMLDQPIKNWNHPNEFHDTLLLMQATTSTVKFLNEKEIITGKIFSDLIKTNKSFCIFPFIQLHTTYDYTQLCCRSSKPVTKLSELTDFNTDPNYQRIRQSMIKGEMLPDYCQDCYNRENKGIVSARQSETTEWVYRLGIKDIDSLKNIRKPAFYDLRPSNKCNLLCRSCNPDDSHLIEKEYKKLKIAHPSGRIISIDVEKHQPDRLDLVEFDNIKKLAVAGGEPTIMPSFFKFLEKCIATDNTNFEINVTTNGTTLSNRLKNLVKQFDDFSWVFSIDGYNELNYYSRHPSNWNNIVDNWRYNLSQKNKVAVNTTISIYNINTLDKLFKWIDQEFPNTLISCMVVNGPVYLDPLLFPDRDSVLQSLERVMQTNCYKNVTILETTINSLYQQFQDRIEINEPLLKEFFKFNDLLDSNRNIHLRDYVPILEKYREKYVY
jgi:molybdenum cofactor biosynthesis enzyme MoaA